VLVAVLALVRVADHLLDGVESRDSHPHGVGLGEVAPLENVASVDDVADVADALEHEDHLVLLGLGGGGAGAAQQRLVLGHDLLDLGDLVAVLVGGAEGVDEGGDAEDGGLARGVVEEAGEHGHHGAGGVLVEGEGREPAVDNLLGQLAAQDDLLHESDAGVGLEQRKGVLDKLLGLVVADAVVDLDQLGVLEVPHGVDHLVEDVRPGRLLGGRVVLQDLADVGHVAVAVGPLVVVHVEQVGPDLAVTVLQLPLLLPDESQDLGDGGGGPGLLVAERLEQVVLLALDPLQLALGEADLALVAGRDHGQVLDVHVGQVEGVLVQRLVVAAARHVLDLLEVLLAPADAVRRVQGLAAAHHVLLADGLGPGQRGHGLLEGGQDALLQVENPQGVLAAAAHVLNTAVVEAKVEGV